MNNSRIRNPALVVSTLALVTLVACTSDPPVAPEQGLLRKSGCTVCHSSQRKLVGPAYRDIAARYGGIENAIPRLVRKVKSGSQGGWGSEPMPPNPTLSDEDAAVMVTFILSIGTKAAAPPSQGTSQPAK